MPARVLGRMVLSVAVDAAVGGIPVLGDALDFVWKANERKFRPAHAPPRRFGKAQLDQLLASRAAVLISLALAAVVAPVVLLVWARGQRRASLERLRMNLRLTPA